MVVLLDAEVGAARRHDILDMLAARCRVVAPDLSAVGVLAPRGDVGSTGFSTWLRGFLDGLGILCAHLVAREPFAARALNFCLMDPLRVDRLVLFHRDTVDPAVVAESAPDLLAGTGQPLLVRREPEPGDCADDVLRFLLGDEIATA